MIRFLDFDSSDWLKLKLSLHSPTRATNLNSSNIQPGNIVVILFVKVVELMIKRYRARHLRPVSESGQVKIWNAFIGQLSKGLYPPLTEFNFETLRYHLESAWLVRVQLIDDTVSVWYMISVFIHFFSLKVSRCFRSIIEFCLSLRFSQKKEKKKEKLIFFFFFSLLFCHLCVFNRNLAST